MQLDNLPGDPEAKARPDQLADRAVRVEVVLVEEPVVELGTHANSLVFHAYRHPRRPRGGRDRDNAAGGRSHGRVRQQRVHDL